MRRGLVPKFFSGNQLALSMANSRETDLKKTASLKQNQNSPQVMPPEARKQRVINKTDLENTSVDFNTLNKLEGSINTYDTGGESGWESDFSTDVRGNNPLESNFSHWKCLHFGSIY